MANIGMTEQEFEQQIQSATARGERLPRIEAASFDGESRRLVLSLSNRCTFMVPVDLLQGTQGATDAQLARIEILGAGGGIEWPEIGVDAGLDGLMAGIFGNKSWMASLGRSGGSVKSERKATASRENGRKGGRPKRVSVAS